MEPELDRRLSVRKALRVKVLLAAKRSAPVEVQAIDLSIGGMCVSVRQQLVTGQLYQVTFDMLLHGRTRRVSAVTEAAYCIYNNKDGFQTGLRFIEIDPGSEAIIAEYMAD